MTKLMMTAALALVLGAGVASAATTSADAGIAAPPRLLFAQVLPQSSYGQRQAARWGSVGPGSSAWAVDSFAGNANSGNPSVPGAPAATTVNGGGR